MCYRDGDMIELLFKININLVQCSLQASQHYLFICSHVISPCFFEVHVSIWPDGSLARLVKVYLFRVMRKPTFAYAKTKTQISFEVTAKLISAIVFAI